MPTSKQDKEGLPSKEQQKADAEQAKADKDRHEVSAPVAPDGSGTTKEYQIEHGKAPIEPGPEKEVDELDAAAAKANRGRGLGG